MKISKVRRKVGSGQLKEIIPDVSGVVKKVEMSLGTEKDPSACLKVEIEGSSLKKEFMLWGVGLPRINVGEEVIFHLEGKEVCAVQVKKGEDVIFRFFLPFDGAHFYQFVDA